MRRAILVALAAATLGTGPAGAASMGQYEVFGVDDDDMLKMREGPGTGYVVIVGLPNGTVLQVHDCQQSGATNWCRVSLDRARRLKGYVSLAYLRKM
ncbi:SH3 domain-containing protein [Marinibacterium profundimaris]|uniref:Peptide-binding protein n=1 Tax=Marinibacterium profundimaris TaxID=1679460 RepID=A0A225NNV7_9RHOB|nr:SH3 domain-containing protein [Marinibacterium profundimaris]OWU76095.1 peptide-binding protein [Marinibacterium profundimaris]